MSNTNTSQGKPSLPISRLFPNIITIMAICFGFTAVRYALDQKWDFAIIFIIVAGFLDVVDGRLARFLKATSNFGAQLDSLADFVNFGISPAIVIYLWCLNSIETRGLGWAMALFYVICSAIRLARFNADSMQVDRPQWRDGFFTGIPAPAGAYLAVSPIMLSFNFDLLRYTHPVAIGIYLVLIGALMASRIPTFATKKLIIRKEYISLFLVFAGLLIGIIIMEPWITLPIIALTYILSIPLSIMSFRKYTK